MLTIHVWPRRLKEFLLTHPLYKSPIKKRSVTFAFAKSLIALAVDHCLLSYKIGYSRNTVTNDLRKFPHRILIFQKRQDN